MNIIKVENIIEENAKSVLTCITKIIGKIIIKNIDWIIKKKEMNIIKNIIKKQKIEQIIGCNIEIAINYLLETFKKNYGYKWDGIEPVHIDHIVPLATAKTEEEVIELFNYKNLQLLKAKDNLCKGTKLDWRLDNVK